MIISDEVITLIIILVIFLPRVVAHMLDKVLSKHRLKMFSGPFLILSDMLNNLVFEVIFNLVVEVIDEGFGLFLVLLLPPHFICKRIEGRLFVDWVIQNRGWGLRLFNGFFLCRRVSCGHTLRLDRYEFILVEVRAIPWVSILVAIDLHLLVLLQDACLLSHHTLHNQRSQALLVLLRNLLFS